MEKDRANLQRRIEALQLKLSQLMRGRLVPSTRAQIVQREIIEVKNEIKRLDREAAERLALEKAPMEKVLEVIAIPLLADVMNDLVARVDGTLRRAGVQETIFGEYVRQIRSAALAMVDTLEHADSNLPRLLDVNDTLVDAVHKKLMSFIKQRLKITK